MTKLAWTSILCFGAAAIAQAATGCGSEVDQITTADDGGADGANGDGTSGGPGGRDGSFADAIITTSRADAGDCKAVGAGCGGSGDCCTANCVGSLCAPPPTETACKLPQAACAANTECCTGSCTSGTCSNKQCVADNGTCGVDGDCCGGSCTPDGAGKGTCKPLNGSCKTSGNPCAGAAECCSKLCNAGLCSDAVSFCTQETEACATSFDCCTGNCVKAAGAPLGTCGGALGNGAGGCKPSGTVCTAGSGDSVCEQSCCSRSCGPFGGLNGFRVCQPPSGCHPTGEICRADSDCCGWSGSPEPKAGFVECSKPANAEFGRCNNGNACREPGSICKAGGPLSCSAENNCCETTGLPSGNCNNSPENCCRQDALGIPRCLIAFRGDCATKPPAGTVCATSADCCGAPCIENKCLAAGSCVAKGGECTTTADCCTGVACTLAPGASKGICGGTLVSDGGVNGSPGDGGPNLPDGGSCALYGQACTQSGDCCSAVPCTKDVGASTGNCRYP